MFTDQCGLRSVGIRANPRLNPSAADTADIVGIGFVVTEDIGAVEHHDPCAIGVWCECCCGPVTPKCPEKVFLPAPAAAFSRIEFSGQGEFPVRRQPEYANHFCRPVRATSHIPALRTRTSSPEIRFADSSPVWGSIHVRFSIILAIIPRRLEIGIAIVIGFSNPITDRDRDCLVRLRNNRLKASVDAAWECRLITPVNAMRRAGPGAGRRLIFAPFLKAEVAFHSLEHFVIELHHAIRTGLHAGSAARDAPLCFLQRRLLCPNRAEPHPNPSVH